MQLKPGARLRSAVCTTEVVVVRTPADDVDVRCGGTPMIPIADDAPGGAVAAGFDGGTLLGKRYADADLGLEMLCTKAGDGALSIGDTLVDLKDAKPLPSSD
jgi:hypothetical protein